jgi:SAM-dependent methyltransferase
MSSVIEYRRFVSRLLAAHRREDALKMAVGDGNFDAVGDAQLTVLIDAGLLPGDSLIDLGCGSGRLASALTRRMGDKIQYLGVDVVPELLTFAGERSCSAYKFALTDGGAIPAADCSVHLVAAFSLFTHLKRHERQSYFHEAHRVLRPNGKLVLSFLEPWEHRKIMLATLYYRVRGSLPHHNAFAPRFMVSRWALQAGFRVDRYISRGVGQTVAVLWRVDNRVSPVTPAMTFQ